MNASLVALAVAGLLAPCGQAAQYSLSTMSEWDGTTFTDPADWGPAPVFSPTYGQTFTRPADLDASFLTTIHYRLSYSGDLAINYKAYVYEWVSGAVSGAPLFTSDPLVTGGLGLGQNQNLAISTGLVPLTSGQEYMIFVTALPSDPAPSAGASWGYLTLGASSALPYVGQFFYTGVDSTTPAGWANSGNWNAYSTTADLAFEFTFVPEPEAYGIAAAIGLLGFAWMRRRRK